MEQLYGLSSLSTVLYQTLAFFRQVSQLNKAYWQKFKCSMLQIPFIDVSPLILRTFGQAGIGDPHGVNTQGPRAPAAVKDLLHNISMYPHMWTHDSSSSQRWASPMCVPQSGCACRLGHYHWLRAPQSRGPGMSAEHPHQRGRRGGLLRPFLRWAEPSCPAPH